MKTLQEQIHETLGQAGIPAKEIKVYGSQIMVTALSLSAAQKWHSLLNQFCKVVRSCQSVDYAKKNTNTVLLPDTVPVWRVWGTI